jgi:hypothetical protein
MPKYLNQIIIKENKKIFNKVIEEINNKYKSECSICFELTNNKTNCNHDVCLDCEKKINKCPLCRRDLNLLKRNLSPTETISPAILNVNYIINQFYIFPEVMYSSFDYETRMRIDDLHMQLYEVIQETVHSRLGTNIWIQILHSFLDRIIFISCRIEHLQTVLLSVGHLEHSIDYNNPHPCIRIPQGIY